MNWKDSLSKELSHLWKNQPSGSSQGVITQEKDGQVSLCTYPQELNKELKQEHFTLPTLDDSLHELRNARVFSKAELSAG